MTIVGLVAATMTTGSFLPQAIKSWQTRKTKDISLWAYIVLLTGVALWLVYGIARNDLSLIMANSITLALVAFILLLKIKYT